MVRKSTLILVIVFATLLAATIFLTQGGEISAIQTPTPTALPTQPPVFGLETGAVAGIEVQAEDGRTAAFLKGTDGTWTGQTASSAPVANESAAAVALSINSWQILSQLDPVPALDAIGLDTPAYTITLRWENGQRTRVLVGNATPSQTGYYISLEGGQPFIIDRFNIDSILTLFEQVTATPTPEVTPPAADTTPAPDATLTTPAGGTTAAPTAAGTPAP